MVESEVPRGETLHCPFCSYVARDREDFRHHVQDEHPDKAD